VLLAFAPAVARADAGWRVVEIRLAAAEDEPGVFCRWFGWSVAWSTVCLDAADGQAEQEGDDDASADLGQESERALEDQGAETGDGSSGESGRELSGEAARDAVENAGQGVLAPVTSSLDKLRNYLQRQRAERLRQASPDAATEQPGPALRDAETAALPSARAPDLPPIPNLRPERRDDLVIVDGEERFAFHRTPRPAFKPTPEEPVILPPLAPRASSSGRREEPPPPPPARPTDLLSMREAAPAAVAAAVAPRAPAPAAGAILDAPAVDDQTVASLEPVDDAAALPALDDADETEAALITFEPGRPGVPEDILPQLRAVLDEARQQQLKIHIIGEASTSHLARRRATDVGAALVQLGATVEILEYDHRAAADADRVRLVLKPAPPDVAPTAADG
jgi:hypothetical protein